jgi:hypothetical protein
MRTRRTMHQQLSMNAEGQQFPRPQLLTPDENHIGRNTGKTGNIIIQHPVAFKHSSPQFYSL